MRLPDVAEARYSPMRPLRWHGRTLKVFRIVNDKDFGEVWQGFLDHSRVYILKDEDMKVVEDQALIDELDNRYGIPVAERNIDYD